MTKKLDFYLFTHCSLLRPTVLHYGFFPLSILLRSYSENRNKKFQIQGGGLRPSLNLSGGGECPSRPTPLYPPLCLTPRIPL